MAEPRVQWGATLGAGDDSGSCEENGNLRDENAPHNLGRNYPGQRG